MATHLLSDERLADMLNQPLEQQHTGIPTLDAILTERSISSSAIEQAWLMDLLSDFKILVRPLTDKAKELLTYWFRKYEITNLKTIIRGKVAGLPAHILAEQLIEVGPIATLPVEELLRTEDVSELLRRLDNSPYGNIARHARRVFELDHQLYSLDAAIDRHYLLELDKRAHALDITQKKHLLPLLGISMDRFNLLWLLRYRFAYQLSPAETYYLLLPTAYQLNPTNLFALVELNTLQEVLTHLPSPLRHLLADTNDIPTVENRLNAEIRRIAQHTLQWHSFSLAKVIAYMTLRELEMHRVLAIVKGKKLGLRITHIQAAAELL